MILRTESKKEMTKQDKIMKNFLYCLLIIFSFFIQIPFSSNLYLI